MIDFKGKRPVNKRHGIESLAAWWCPASGQSRTGQGKEYEEMNECTGTIKRVVSPSEVTQLKSLFAMVDREGPRGDLLGVIDLSESPGCAACSERLSWGYTAYCQNSKRIGEIESQAGTEPRTEPGP
jgi:hypothetical protein